VNLYFIRLLDVVSLFFSEKTSYPLVTENDRHNRQKENNESEVTREIVVISAKKEKPNPNRETHKQPKTSDASRDHQ
jgi:hypothetical protein